MCCCVSAALPLADVQQEHNGVPVDVVNAVASLVNTVCDRAHEDAVFAESWSRHSAIEALKSQLYEDWMRSLVSLCCCFVYCNPINECCVCVTVGAARRVDD